MSLNELNPETILKGVCDDDDVSRYKGRFRYEVPPNIFAVAEVWWNLVFWVRLNENVGCMEGHEELAREPVYYY